MPAFACFVTGTDTEVGKTLISCALLHHLGQYSQTAIGMKPVAAGAGWVTADKGDGTRARSTHSPRSSGMVSAAGRAGLAAARDDLQLLPVPPDVTPTHNAGPEDSPAGEGSWHNDDVDLLAAHSQLKLATELTTPYLLKTPVAPHIAAMREQKTIELDVIMQRYVALRAQSDAVVVEGVGGFRVPLSDSFDTADLAQQLNLPVILVVGMRLGCLNHALLTAEAIAARGLRLAGWVANLVDDHMPYLLDNSAALAARLNAPLLGCVPRLSPASASMAAAHLDFSALPNWPGPSLVSTF